MASHKELLLDLVAYVRSIQPRKRHAHTLSSGSVLLEEEEAQAFPGVHLSPEEGVWVRVERTGEPIAPPLPPRLAPVIRGAVDLAANRPLVREYPDPVHPGSSVSEEATEGEPFASHRPNTEEGVAAQKDNHETILSRETWESLSIEADSWISDVWDGWSQEVALVRKSNEFYQRLFHVMTNLKLDGAAETQEIVCGVGTVSWKVGTHTLHHPLLLQACEIVMLDGSEGILEIRPASAVSDVSLDMFSQAGVPSVGVARKWMEEQDLLNEIDLNPFDPASFSFLLEGLAGRLDPKSKIREAVSPPGPDLEIDCHWVFFMRDRPNDRLWRDLEAWEGVLESLEDEEEIPLFLRAMVDKNILPPPKGAPVAWRGSEPVGAIGQADEVQTLYFPLPYNTEQAQIIEHLEGEFGAIVQGPPGTGKSHTIANVISHYLAHGKRILVAASSAAALEVVRGKLPRQIRDLAAALLSSDAQGLAEFEQSLSEIEHRLANFNAGESRERVAHLESQLESIHAAIASLDSRIEDLVSGHLEWVEVEGQQILLSEVASRVAGMDAPETPIPGNVPTSLDEATVRVVERARHLMEGLGGRLVDPEARGSLPASLPSLAQVEEFVQASDAVKGIGKHREANEIATPVSSHLEDQEELLEVLQKRAVTFERVQRFLKENEQGWTQECLDKVSLLPESDPVVGRLKELAGLLEENFKNCRSLDGRVTLNPSHWLSDHRAAEEAREGLVRLIKGEQPFAWWQTPFRGDAKTLLHAVHVDGEHPKSPKEWALVGRRLNHFRYARRLFRQWNSLVKALGLKQEVSWSIQVSSVTSQCASAAKACLDERELRRNLSPKLDDLLSRMFRPHPGLGSQGSLDPSLQEATVVASFKEMKREAKAHESLRRWEDYLSELQESGPFGRRLVANAQEVEVGNAATYWARATEEMGALHQVQASIDELKNCTNSAEKAGFDEWPALWVPSLPSPNPPYLITEGWQQDWRHRAYSQCLEGMPSGQQVEDLLVHRHELVGRLSRYITEVSSEKAWAGLVENATPDTRRALKEYAGAVRRQGRGQGRRAQRHRATARRAMEKAFAAIGCWVMPHGRVCESMPPQLGLFDLIIIDEASQSDIQALPTLLRGKQLLIVGDDKQVSPEAVGVSEDSILKSLNNELARQPYRSHMTQDRSLYDLFGAVFATRDIMLREHFRSTEAIISYSNRHYYHGKILPMRVPRANERLDPPLIDVLVRNGVYRNDVNMGEAEWIAEEVERLVSDPAYAGKSIGVVTLTSNDKQSIAIHNALDSRIPVHSWVAHQITVGPPPVFQGKERDIMFVSMVWDGRNPRSGANRTPMFEKRFNVAMSRGRDRVYLVRSNEGRPFRPGSLLAEVVEHFRNPIPERPENEAQTDFEKILSGRLEKEGYRVIHHPGGKTLGLDMVVEDDFGSRLGIQCDGDRPPGTGASWRHQMRQHRSLERSGWEVWRGFCADFNQDQDQFMQKVRKALEDAGVQKSDPKKNGQLELVDNYVVGKSVEASEEEVENLEAIWPENPELWPQDKDLLTAMCDSPFENEVLGALLSRGYRVHPQYPLGGYRIDFVVQGPGGNRLAIECDGDTFHGMDKYEADKARQAWLEKTGSLAFWRCWYSDWRAKRKSCLEDMWRALEQAGVKPFRK